jgi:hypothetical protein
MTEHKGIKITSEDLAVVSVQEPVAAPQSPIDGKPRVYGSINAEPTSAPAVSEQKGSILLQGWCYLGIAGLMGAFLGWGVCEPGFVDSGDVSRWGNVLLVPAVVTLMCVFLAIAESLVERSVKRALVRGGLSLLLGIVFGFVFYGIANVAFAIGLSIISGLGILSQHNPAFWAVRGLAWAVFGAAGGIVYGLIGKSVKKGQYGVIGGLIGAGLGGAVFDPIAFATGGGAPSRAVGFALFGMATGIAIGIVESAFKERWLYVASGPLAGKQFILYKQFTSIGSKQDCDIYLFKDTSIAPDHASLEMRGHHVQLTALGEVYVSGQPVRSRILQSGDLIQIGRYAFRYQERQKS